MSEKTNLLKTCENSSPVDRSVVYDAALYECESDYLVKVEWPWGYGEKRFERYTSALQYYAAEAYKATNFDFRPYDGRA